MKRLLKNPYLIVSVVFLAIIMTGVRYWDWEQRELGFALLLYFIVALGVRLDEIAHQLMEINEKFTHLLGALSRRDEDSGKS